MDLQQAGTSVPGRTEAFYHGVTGTPEDAVSAMGEASQRFNDKVGKGFTPHSVLSGIPGMSGNGMSPEDAQRQLPGGQMLPSSNGIAQGNYESTIRLRMLGDRGEF